MLLELNKIEKRFIVPKSSFQKSVVRAVDGVDLVLRKGENLGLVGESGCGKTTLARIILKLTTLDNGVIRFQDKDITNLRGTGMREYRRRLQMVFQDPYSSLDPRLTIFNILSESFTLKEKKTTSAEREKAMQKVMLSVGLPDNVLTRYPHEFSGGERQRIAIARALLMNPQLLVLDEAVSSLDVLIQQQLIELLLKLQKDFAVTYLFISHNLRVVRKIAARIAVMYRGKIVENAATDDIFQNPQHPYTRRLLRAALDYKDV